MSSLRPPGSISTVAPGTNPAARKPKAAKAAIDRFGSPEVLTIHELPVPTVGTDEVLIALHTAGVGSWDADIRDGWYPEGDPRFPLVLGTDGSGTVAALGSRIRRFKLGDRVYSYDWINPKGGFYAEYVAVPESVIWKNDRAKLPPEIATLQEPFGNAVFATSAPCEVLGAISTR